MTVPLLLAAWSPWLTGILSVLFLAVAVLMVLTVLIQKPQGGGLAAAFGAGASSGQTAFGANGREFYTARTNLDVNVEYKLSKRFTFFANARNLLNEPQRLVRYGDLTPDYARFYQDEEFGVQMSVGVKGTW